MASALSAGTRARKEVDRIPNTETNVPAEIAFEAKGEHADPFMSVSLDVEFTDPEGTTRKAPAFWAGGKTWKVRYASPVMGTHTFRSICDNESDTGLHGVEGTVEIASYTGDNPLYKHGPLRVSDDKRHFEHHDGTPFLWLGDTWWKCLCKRMTWEGFQELTADRAAKGFSVIQIVCGPYPDEDHFQKTWKNEGGFPYLKEDFSEVNPEYFDYADRRIFHLVEAGLVPAVVGSWGRGDCDGMALAGVDGMKRHWRHLVARYGALPTIWIVGGESEGPLWTETARYVREVDLHDRPTTVHPFKSGRDSVTDESAINFDMLQTGHGGWPVARTVVPKLKAAEDREPPMPVVIGEHSYEQHMQTGFADVQRHVFWASALGGSAGLTYGAAGVWHAGVEGDPGLAKVYDRTTWREGMNFAGSTQLGIGKALLEQYSWERFEVHPEWADEDCHAAGIPGDVRFIFQPRRKAYDWNGTVVKGLESNVRYSAFYFDPVTGKRDVIGIVEAAGEYKPPPLPSPQDWVLVLARTKD